MLRKFTSKHILSLVVLFSAIVVCFSSNVYAGCQEIVTEVEHKSKCHCCKKKCKKIAKEALRRADVAVEQSGLAISIATEALAIANGGVGIDFATFGGTAIVTLDCNPAEQPLCKAILVSKLNQMSNSSIIDKEHEGLVNLPSFPFITPVSNAPFSVQGRFSSNGTLEVKSGYVLFRDGSTLNLEIIPPARVKVRAGETATVNFKPVNIP